MVIAVVSVGVVVLGVIQQIQASKSMPTAVTIAQYDCGDGYAWVIKNENNVVLPGNWIETGEPTIALHNINELFLIKAADVRASFILYSRHGYDSPLGQLGGDGAFSEITDHNDCIRAAAKADVEFEPFAAGWSFAQTDEYMKAHGY